MSIHTSFHKRIIHAFDRWAISYESDVQQMLRGRGYTYQMLAGEVLACLHPKAGDLLLEIGTGPGTLGAEVAAQSSAKLIGCDISAQMVARAAQRSSYLAVNRANAERLPFETHSADGLYSAFMMHSVFRQARAFHEIHRVLKQGKSAVLVDLCPVGRSLWLATTLGFVHSLRREFGAPAVYVPVEHYVRLALETGFSITAVRSLGVKKRYSHFLIALKKDGERDR